MSRHSTDYRPLARMGWGGRAASHWRGLLSSNSDPVGLAATDPQVLGPSWRGQIGTRIYEAPPGFANYAITGVTRDSGGAALAGCTVDLFITSNDTLKYTTVSDAGGNFSFDNPGTGPFYLVAYKPGAPDVAGTTVNTLVPAAI